MSDSTTPQDDAAMPPASIGSVAERPLGDPEVAVEILKLRVAELEQAICRLADEDATLSVCDRVVTVTVDTTLTDEEREAIKDAISCCEDITYGGAADQEAADVLKALLKRTK